MSGGVRRSSGSSTTSHSSTSGSPMEEIQKLFQSKLQQIQDPAEKELMSALMDKAKGGNATEEELKVIAEMLGIPFEKLAGALGDKPVPTTEPEDIQ